MVCYCRTLVPITLSVRNNIYISTSAPLYYSLYSSNLRLVIDIKRQNLQQSRNHYQPSQRFCFKRTGVMHWTSRGDVSIIELIVYFPALLIAFLVCNHHGFHRASGWIYTLILCLIRIIGSGCQLATYHDESNGLLETTLILELVGISPILFATLGLISRT